MLEKLLSQSCCSYTDDLPPQTDPVASTGKHDKMLLSRPKSPKYIIIPELFFFFSLRLCVFFFFFVETHFSSDEHLKAQISREKKWAREEFQGCCHTRRKNSYDDKRGSHGGVVGFSLQEHVETEDVLAIFIYQLHKNVSYLTFCTLAGNLSPL